MLGQQVNRRFHCRQRPGARGVGDKAGATEVEDVGDAAGQDVGQLPRHGIFGDGGQAAADFRVPILDNCLLQVTRQPGKLAHSFESAGVFGEVDAQAGDVVEFPTHRRPQHDAGALGVQRPLWVAIVG